MTRHRTLRRPYVVVFQEQAEFKDTYGGLPDRVVCEAMQIRPVERESKTAIVFSHPIGGGSFLPIMRELAAAGHHVVYVNTRYRGNDSALIMEKCVVDLAACVRDMRTRFGYERIVLGGWSGGGSLALFYQEQARKSTVLHTPAGDPPDLSKEEIVAGDAIFLVAAHVSRASTLTEWMDASILDESDPTQHDRALDLYDPEGPQPPYDAEFLARYAAAQVARNRRITAWVRERLAALAPGEEQGFVVQGTMAAPCFLDPAVDPNERVPGQCYLGDPRSVNNGPVGLARFCTLRSWLSQWSYDESNAQGERNGANTDVPTLVIGNLADDACTPSHTHRLYQAIPHERKELHEIAGATHYYLGQPAQLAQCVGLYTDWLGRVGMAD